MNRRQFLKTASVSTLWLGIHGNVAFGRWTARSHTETVDAPRILSLELHTSAPLKTMKDFYLGMLKFPVLEESSDQITFQASGTNLTFVKSVRESEEPAYHFAFNIPENKILSARNWQAERTALITPRQQHLRDPRFPEDIIHFSHWNAHSVFFYDPAGNLLEYIARHDLGNAADGPFTTKDILYASEIAFVVDDVRHTAGEISKVSGLQQYRGGSQQFTAIGDEHGLLLVMKRGRRAFGQGKPRDVFPTQAVISGEENAQYEMPGYPHELIIDS